MPVPDTQDMTHKHTQREQPQCLPHQPCGAHPTALAVRLTSSQPYVSSHAPCYLGLTHAHAPGAATAGSAHAQARRRAVQRLKQSRPRGPCSHGAAVAESGKPCAHAPLSSHQGGKQHTHTHHTHVHTSVSSMPSVAATDPHSATGRHGRGPHGHRGSQVPNGVRPTPAPRVHTTQPRGRTGPPRGVVRYSRLQHAPTPTPSPHTHTHPSTPRRAATSTPTHTTGPPILMHLHLH